ncbi:MAG: hypothetical protein IPO25_18735 [Saprospiraceae bacterium]|nr:hypothetical protein [Saprospiraceae bacterium]
MADNDLALGRILHFLSRTKYWKNMLVIITEDDPQEALIISMRIAAFS